MGRMTPLDRFKAWVHEQSARGIRQRHVAATLDVDASTLSKILKGERAPNGAAAAAIERATESWAHGPIRAVSWYPPKSAVAA